MSLIYPLFAHWNYHLSHAIAVYVKNGKENKRSLLIFREMAGKDELIFDARLS